MIDQSQNSLKERFPIIELRDVSLEIPVVSQETRSLKKALVRSVTGGMLKRTKRGAVVQALKNINCSIFAGERVALIGHNGAGKSTFLRLISKIYHPSCGQLILNCNVYPLINKAFLTGPELSGYQAAKAHYLMTNFSLKGFDQFIEEVISFSGLGDFIHLPMSGYSEGMSARLLFTLLTSGSYECLVMDEGFGTGDADFFEKAQKRLAQFMQTTGTLLLASHSDELLRQFCSRGLVFSQGKIIYDGPINDALLCYHHGYSS